MITPLGLVTLIINFKAKQPRHSAKDGRGFAYL